MSITLDSRMRWSYALDCSVQEWRALITTSAGVKLETEWTAYESIARLDAKDVLRQMAEHERGETHPIGA